MLFKSYLGYSVGEIFFQIISGPTDFRLEFKVIEVIQETSHNNNVYKVELIGIEEAPGANRV